MPWAYLQRLEGQEIMLVVVRLPTEERMHANVSGIQESLNSTMRCDREHRTAEEFVESLEIIQLIVAASAQLRCG